MPSSPSTREAIGRPREPRADDAIRTAALELIAERGMRSLRMDDIAKRAGVGKATIYRRYRSKDELVSDAVSAQIDEIEIPDTGATRTDVLELMLDAVKFYSRSPLARVMSTILDEMNHDVEFAGLVRERFLTARRVALRTVFERAIQRGDLRGDLDVELALDVLAGPLVYRLLITGGPIDSRLAENVTDLILRGFAASPPPSIRTPTKKDRKK
jgi:AcrR family transcriptional regulator